MKTIREKKSLCKTGTCVSDSSETIPMCPEAGVLGESGGYVLYDEQNSSGLCYLISGLLLILTTIYTMATVAVLSFLEYRSLGA